MATTSIKLRNERTNIHFCGDDMSRITYSNVNHAIHAASIANHGIALSSSRGTCRHVEVLVVVEVVEGERVVLEVEGSSHSHFSRNMGSVSKQNVTMETTMTEMEMTATTRAHSDVSGYSKSCQILRCVSPSGRMGSSLSST